MWLQSLLSQEFYSSVYVTFFLFIFLWFVLRESSKHQIWTGKQDSGTDHVSSFEYPQHMFLQRIFEKKNALISRELTYHILSINIYCIWKTQDPYHNICPRIYHSLYKRGSSCLKIYKACYRQTH